MTNRNINALSDFTIYEHIIPRDQINQSPRKEFKVSFCKIEFDFSIIDNDEYLNIEFKHCIFSKKVSMINSVIHGNVSFINCIFENSIELIELTINGKARFYETTFNLTKIDNLRFIELSDFFKSKFNKTVIFYKTDFLGKVVFTGVEFSENVLFTYSNIEDTIIFSRTIFQKGLDLSQAIIGGNILINNSDFINFENIKDIDNDELYRKSYEIDGIITLQNKRETIRILKKASRDENNQFKYLEYSKLENETYYEQLKYHWKKRFDNYIIFKLNHSSNRHNMSWSRGVIFTCIVGLVFFYLALINTSKIEVGLDYKLFDEYLGKYMLFLSPLHTIELFQNNGITFFTIFWDFIGKIFISYGIYQTIQAFRKYKG